METATTEEKQAQFVDELVLYVVVNKDVSMTAAKVAVQVGHACTFVVVDAARSAYESPISHENQRLGKWFQQGKHQKKVVLVASQKVLEELIACEWTAVRDNGHNEVAPDTLTCVTPGIVLKSWMAPIVKKHRMQVYRHKEPAA